MDKNEENNVKCYLQIGDKLLSIFNTNGDLKFKFDQWIQIALIPNH